MQNTKSTLGWYSHTLHSPVWGLILKPFVYKKGFSTEHQDNTLGKEFKCILFGKDWNYLNLMHGNSQSSWEKIVSSWKCSWQDREESPDLNIHKTPIQRKAELRLQKLSARSSLIRNIWVLEGKANTAWLFSCWVQNSLFSCCSILEEIQLEAWAPNSWRWVSKRDVQGWDQEVISTSYEQQCPYNISDMQSEPKVVLLNMVTKSHPDPASFPACKTW